MDVPISHFVANLKAKSFGKPNALLIGFEASARLLGNDLASVALSKGLGLASTGDAITSAEIRRAWNQKGRDDQYSFLRSAFSAKAPNENAIRDLACIIRDGRIGAIIATDPACALQQQLVSYQVLDPGARFDCCSGVLEYFDQIRESFGDGPIFIDAGEILIEGLTPPVLGFDHLYERRIEAMLQKASDHYDKTICWGWSHYNTTVGRIWTSQEGRYYVLGQDSDNNQTYLRNIKNTYVVDRANSRSKDVASLDLLRAVAQDSCPGGEPPQRVGVISDEQIVGAQTAQPRYNSLPLLCDEASAAEFIRESRLKRLAVIGVNASSVRSRLASLLVHLIVKNKDMVEHETVSHLEEITDRVTSFKEEPESLFWVVEFVGGKQLPILEQKSFQNLTSKITESSKLKTLLLVPSFYAEEIVRATRSLKLSAETLTFQKLFTPDRLRIWLHQVFPELEQDAEERLAGEMCRVALEIENADWTSPDGLDRIHFALNRWSRSVVFRNQDLSDLELLLKTWRKALESFAQRNGGEPPDADDWGIRPLKGKRPPRLTRPPGVIRPRRGVQPAPLPDDLEEFDLHVVSRPQRDPKKGS